MNMIIIVDIHDDVYIYGGCNNVRDIVIIVPKVSRRGSFNYGYGLATCSSTWLLGALFPINHFQIGLRVNFFTQQKEFFQFLAFEQNLVLTEFQISFQE